MGMHLYTCISRYVQKPIIIKCISLVFLLIYEKRDRKNDNMYTLYTHHWYMYKQLYVVIVCPVSFYKFSPLVTLSILPIATSRGFLTELGNIPHM